MEINNHLTILEGLEKVKLDLSTACGSINDDLFFHQPADKWSIAQNVAHLAVSIRITELAYRLPKFIVHLYGGKPNRPSRTYDELVEKYKQKLQSGGRASGIYIPKSVSSSLGKDNVINEFARQMDRLILSIQNKWEDEELDKYIVPHPLLGKITLRELAYFTIYHIYHHLSIIQERLK